MATLLRSYVGQLKSSLEAVRFAGGKTNAQLRDGGVKYKRFGAVALTPIYGSTSIHDFQLIFNFSAQTNNILLSCEPAR